ncbi:MAG: CaiB/BaiF CoA-transferase family protein [Bradyrhizobium sp.]
MAGGPLVGRRIVEFAGVGPAPFCGMLLADLGADVVRVESPTVSEAKKAVPILDTRFDVANRGKRAVQLDLKHDRDQELARHLLTQADALIEGYRPGVMERLHLGPDACRAINPRLVYGRMTGWGQSGPLANAAGHDINFISLSGVLHAIGTDGGPPAIPLNLIGDYAGGLMLAFGIVSAMLEATTSGQGEVIDAAMSEGSAVLMAAIYGFRAAGLMPHARGRNILDGGAHFYGVYECADGEWIAVGALEREFYTELLERCDIDDPEFERQLDPASWPALRARLEVLFRSRTRDEWQDLLAETNACVSPVLSIDEAPRHPHHLARDAFLSLDGVTQPSPAPRFERNPAKVRWSAPARPVEVADVVREWSSVS